MSKFLRGLGSFIQIAGGLLGFVLSLFFVYFEFGGTGVIIALVIFPATFALVPLYSLFVYGTWNLLLINYGGIAAGVFLHWVADKIDQKTQENLNLRQSHDEPALTPLMKAPQAGNPTSGASLPVILLVIAGLILIAIASAISQSSSTPPSTSTLRATKASPTKTPLPRSTRTPRPVSIQACVTNSTVRIRKGPGTEYEAIGGMVSGTCMSIQGRDKESSWVYMVSEDGKTGWVAASLLTIEGNLNRVSLISNTGDLNLAPTSKTIPTSTRKPVAFATNTPPPAVIQPTVQSNNCSPAYPGVCIPPRPPDLDCGDIPYRRFMVLSPDPHGFDRDGDGIGCES